MEFEFGTRDDAMALPVAIMLIDQGMCPDCSQKHYTMDITFLMFYMAVHFSGPSNGLNYEHVG